MTSHLASCGQKNSIEEDLHRRKRHFGLFYFCGPALEAESGVCLLHSVYSHTECSHWMQWRVTGDCTDLCDRSLWFNLFLVVLWNLYQVCKHLFNDGVIELWRVASSVHVTEVRRFSIEFFLCVFFFFFKQNNLLLAFVCLPDNHEFFTADSLPISFFFFFFKAQTFVISKLLTFLLFVSFFFQPVTVSDVFKRVFFYQHNLFRKIRFRIKGSKFQIWNINRCRKYFLFYISLCV